MMEIGGVFGNLSSILTTPFASTIVVLIVSVLLFCLLKRRMFAVKCQLPQVPKVPGVPLLGNLLQLKEKKPYKTFTNWAEIYGPVYSIQLGSSDAIVLSSSEVVKEAMVTRFPAISTKQLSNALIILSANKCMVAVSDYNDFHKTVKKHIITGLLGANAQKRNRHIRETMLENLIDNFNSHVKSNPLEAVNFRKIFMSELFGFSLKQAIGRDLQSLYVEELGGTLSRREVFQILVLDMMQGAIEVDWRDFFPYLKWVPGNRVETNMRKLHSRRMAVMKAIVQEHKRLAKEGKETNAYIDYLMSEASTMTESQLIMLLWEPIIESADTTGVTTEWAIFELAKDPKRQNRLYQEIRSVCGSNKITEDHLAQLPYLSAIFHETLRNHSTVPMVPIRYVHEDTQLGGYHVPAGSQIILNLYGCTRDKTLWEDPESWMPERFMDDKYDPQDLFKTMGFGAGKRVCSGALQAMLVACTSIGRLVQEFEWRLLPGEEADVDTLSLTTHKLKPLHVMVKPRGQI